MIGKFFQKIFDVTYRNLYRSISKKTGCNSSAIIYLVNIDSELRIPNLPYMEIFGDEEFYKALGYNESRYHSEWFKINGISFEDKDGNPIFKDFPVLSKSYWMHVDASRVNFEEIDELIKECDRAIKMDLIKNQAQTFVKIKKMANFAKENNLEIVFGHP